LGGPEGPEPAFGAPDADTTGSAVRAAAATDAVERGMRALRFDARCGFCDCGGACTMSGGNA